MCVCGERKPGRSGYFRINTASTSRFNEFTRRLVYQVLEWRWKEEIDKVNGVPTMEDENVHVY